MTKGHNEEIYIRREGRIMEIQVASRMKDYEEGIFQVLNEKKNQLLENGRKVYNLSVGTPDFKPAQHIMDAVSEAAKKPENYKYALADLPQLIEAVQTRFRGRYGVELDADEITSVYGSQEGMAHIGLSLIDKGDVVLVPNPGYPIFAIGPSLAEAEIITYDLLEENNYLPDLEHMDAKVLKRTKFMIVSYPLNPICKIAPRSFYEELIPGQRKIILLLYMTMPTPILFMTERKVFPFYLWKVPKNVVWNFIRCRNPLTTRVQEADS